MSRWIDVLNRLRRDAAPARLVAAQGEAAADLVSLLRTHDVVNLHGASGSGKTYLGWVMARATGAAHAASPARLGFLAPARPGRPAVRPRDDGAWTQADLTDAVIIDNCPETRLGARSVVDEIRGRGYRRAVLVTRVAVPDHVPRVALQPDEADLDAIAKALGALGWALPPRSAGAASLWGRIWGDGEATAGSPAADTIPGTTIARV